MTNKTAVVLRRWKVASGLVASLICIPRGMTKASNAADSNAQPTVAAKPAAVAKPVSSSGEAQSLPGSSFISELDLLDNPASSAKIKTVAEPQALEDSGLSKTSDPRADNKKFKPLLFAPADNHAELGRAQLSWDLEEGRTLRLSGFTFPSSAISLTVTQIPRLKTASFFSKTPATKQITTISFGCPSLFFGNGEVSIESDRGVTFLKVPVTKDTRMQWRSIMKGFRSSAQAPLATVGKTHSEAVWGIHDIDPRDYPFATKGGNLRACLTRSTPENEKLRVCTGFSAFKPGLTEASDQPSASEVEGAVLLDGKSVGIRGLANFPEGQKIALTVKYANGGFFDITSQPIRLKIYDAVQTESGQTIVLTGQGPVPLGPVKIISNPDTHFWSGTIIKQERVWQIALPSDAPVVNVLGAFNMPFTMLFTSRDLPKERDRIYLADRQQGTYRNKPTLYGLADKTSTVSSSERSAKKIDAEKFQWTYLAPKQAAENRSRLKVIDENKKAWVAHYELYRGYASEVSGAFTGVVSSSGQAAAMGEVMASTWLEDLGFSDRTFALQRWGIFASYFKAFSPITLPTGDVINEFSAISGTLRYNLLHGLINRDQLFGVVLSIQRIGLSSLHDTMAGGGGYWGRAMPKVLDDLFNIFDFMKKPKYLEIDLSYYPFSLSPGVKAGPTFNLNFSGKVFFRPDFFGQAGFGIKQFNFTDNTALTSASLTTAYGLIGLGMMF